ncbi:cytochrome ubiquinol oxidase subunit I [Idiomarina zobellii]|uniref:Cytochrome D ubiquinol oxidase subunit I n=1 Tax=Idiomarina zobellii TaxID=86103 RepID=A0A837NGM2_9GAMM|nr:cytochrome ubiquinol oxidase subunit I [Idiomarina zobellii]KPD23325.1 cytochrome D ubiquinol oxidase subunit I [Idiomarina zobellii]SDG06726.1 cytochrome bd-I ubiquinol oxidase subunit 1 apoprotein [Idiomarina zobellii]
MFESFDALFLARFQFAFTIAFHIIFPAFTIGVASYLAVLEGLYLKTRNPVYQKLFRYWVKIFAVAFGMGVVSGIVMSYQFGTNWSVFSDKAGPVIGPLMGYEVLTAFFLEAGFLGVMLFGMNKVGEKLHFFATLMVAIGTAISAFWILSVNSWMQTPAGYAMNDVGQFVVTDWFEVVFNPSFPYRLAHMLLAAYLTVAFVVGAVGAWHLLKDKTNAAARKMFSMAMWMALIVAPLQVFVGDLHGLNTQEHQPAKVAAMEGHFDTETRAPLYLFGLPNEETAEVDYALKVPGLASIILKHDINAEVTGLDQFPREDWPPVATVFWSFRIMVGIGLLMVLAGLWSGLQRLRGKLYDNSLLLRFSVFMGPMGFVAVIAGWIVTEVGRQPWVIYGLLRTADAASPIDKAGVAGSLIAFIVVYFLVFGAGTFYILRKMAADPEKVTIPEYAKHKPTMAAERIYDEEA